MNTADQGMRGACKSANPNYYATLWRKVSPPGGAAGLVLFLLLMPIIGLGIGNIPASALAWCCCGVLLLTVVLTCGDELAVPPARDENDKPDDTVSGPASVCHDENDEQGDDPRANEVLLTTPHDAAGTPTKDARAHPPTTSDSASEKAGDEPDKLDDDYYYHQFGYSKPKIGPAEVPGRINVLRQMPGDDWLFVVNYIYAEVADGDMFFYADFDDAWENHGREMTDGQRRYDFAVWGCHCRARDWWHGKYTSYYFSPIAKVKAKAAGVDDACRRHPGFWDSGEPDLRKWCCHADAAIDVDAIQAHPDWSDGDGDHDGPLHGSALSSNLDKNDTAAPKAAKTNCNTKPERALPFANSFGHVSKIANEFSQKLNAACPGGFAFVIGYIDDDGKLDTEVRLSHVAARHTAEACSLKAVAVAKDAIFEAVAQIGDGDVLQVSGDAYDSLTADILAVLKEGK